MQDDRLVVLPSCRARPRAGEWGLGLPRDTGSGLCIIRESRRWRARLGLRGMVPRGHARTSPSSPGARCSKRPVHRLSANSLRSGYPGPVAKVAAHARHFHSIRARLGYADERRLAQRGRTWRIRSSPNHRLEAQVPTEPRIEANCHRRSHYDKLAENPGSLRARRRSPRRPIARKLRRNPDSMKDERSLEPSKGLAILLEPASAAHAQTDG